MATKKTAAKKPATKRPRKKKVEPGSVGLTARETAEGTPPEELQDVARRIEDAGGALLARYREPLEGHWVALAALPLEKVEPTPYQRELSKAHAEKLVGVIPKVGRFLDPIIAVPHQDGFITPNGMHRLNAMRILGAKAITALVVPEHEVAYRILALNTEKAHNLRDKALEVVRLFRALAQSAAQKHETDYTLEFENPGLLTLGFCYEQNGRFSGGAYAPVVNRCEEFRDAPLEDTLPLREARAQQLLALDAIVNQAVQRLKDSGFNSGYLKPVVVARINPLRFVKLEEGQKPDFDKTLKRMLAGAEKFDPSKVKAGDFALAASMGTADE